MDSAVSGAVMLSATTAFTVFNGLLPDFSDVRKSTGDAATINDVRMGEVAATVATIGIGLIASSVTKSPAPALIAIAVAGALAFMYESALRTTPQEKATNNDAR